MWRIIIAFVGLVCMLAGLVCGSVALVTGITSVSGHIPTSSSSFVFIENVALTLEIKGIGGWHFTPGEVLLSSAILTLVLLAAAGAAFHSVIQPSGEQCSDRPGEGS
jgi:hypothetical protein